MKVNIVFSMEAKPYLLNVFPKANLYKYSCMCKKSVGEDRIFFKQTHSHSFI